MLLHRVKIQTNFLKKNTKKPTYWNINLLKPTGYFTYRQV